MENSIEGQVVLVTGAARGMGAQHVRGLVGHGARVLAADVLDDEGRLLAAELGDQVVYTHLDVTDERQWRDAVSLAESTFGPVQHLVNNAGILTVGSIEDLTLSDWQRTIDVNLTGVWLGMHCVIPSIKRAGGGSIVNISSTAGREGLADYGAYCATKWAMIGMTQQLALELAPSSIRVNCICPGPTATDMIDGTFRRTAAHHGVPEEAARKAALRRIPLGRHGAAEDQAAAVAYLASDDASFITGQTLNVDGGIRMD